MGSSYQLTSQSEHTMLPVLLIAIILPGRYCQEWQPASSIPPPSLAGDTLVNSLLSEARKAGGLRQVDRNTELVAEMPQGSGRVIVLQSGLEFAPKFFQTDVVNDVTRELIEEESNIIPEFG